LPTPLTYLNLASSNSVITGTLATIKSSLTQIYLASTDSNITGNINTLPSTVTYLTLDDTPSTITGAWSGVPSGVVYLTLSESSSVTGNITDLPAGLVYLAITSGSSCTIDGDLSDLPAGMTSFQIGETASAITGGATPMAATGISMIYIPDLGLSQAVVDGIFLRIYTDRALFSAANPGLFIGGTNDAPSGAYADEDPPVTGNGMRYELAHDPESEGFNTWTTSVT